MALIITMKKNMFLEEEDNDEDEYYIRVNGIVYKIGYTFIYDGFYYIYINVMKKKVK